MISDRGRYCGRVACRRLRAFTLIETLLVLMVVALGAAIVLPRLATSGRVAVEVGARRLADTILLARDRAILSGRGTRVSFLPDGKGWSFDGAASVLPRGVAVRQVTVGGAAVDALAFEPAGDALPARIEIADRRGGAAAVVVPPAGGRPRVVR